MTLAGLQWRIHTRAIEKGRAGVDPSQYLEMKYETFCEQTTEAIRQVVQFAELEPSAGFDRHVAASPIKDTDRWRKDLNVDQQTLLTNLLRDDLLRYGYDVDVAALPAV